MSFVDETRGRNKRGVREVAGISRELRDSFSSRRAAIEDAYETLVQEYVAKHGHTPPKTVQLSLAQRATLETREGKSAPKSLSRQRAEWRVAAIKIIGQVAVDTIGDTVRQPQQRSAQDEILAALSIDELAGRVLNTVEDSRATWRRSHVAAEAQRIARAFANVHPDVDAQQVADQVAQAVMARVIAVTAPSLNPVPEQLQRQDGESIYRVHGTERFTSTRILTIEDSLIDAARTVAGFSVNPATFTATVEALNATGMFPLDASQVELTRRFASGGRLLEVGIGPAGTGKTTAMRAFARAVEADGGRGRRFLRKRSRWKRRRRTSSSMSTAMGHLSSKSPTSTASTATLFSSSTRQEWPPPRCLPTSSSWHSSTGQLFGCWVTRRSLPRSNPGVRCA